MVRARANPQNNKLHEDKSAAVSIENKDFLLLSDVLVLLVGIFETINK